MSIVFLLLNIYSENHLKVQRDYLPRHVFNHGQLYVALSRGVSQNSTKVLIKEGKIEGEDGNFTKKVVFKDILLS